MDCKHIKVYKSQQIAKKKNITLIWCFACFSQCYSDQFCLILPEHITFEVAWCMQPSPLAYRWLINPHKVKTLNPNQFHVLVSLYWSAMQSDNEVPMCHKLLSTWKNKLFLQCVILLFKISPYKAMHALFTLTNLLFMFDYRWLHLCYLCGKLILQFLKLVNNLWN